MGKDALHTDNFIVEAYDRYADMVYKMALLMLRNKADAEDILQEVFFKLTDAPRVFQDEAHLKSWLLKVAVNKCKNQFKTYWNRNRVFTDTLEVPAVDPENREIIGYVMKLPENYKAPLYLYYYLGYTTEETAEILKCPVSTIRTRLKRGRERLRKELEQGGFVDE